MENAQFFFFRHYRSKLFLRLAPYMGQIVRTPRKHKLRGSPPSAVTHVDAACSRVGESPRDQNPRERRRRGNRPSKASVAAEARWPVGSRFSTHTRTTYGGGESIHRSRGRERSSRPGTGEKKKKNGQRRRRRHRTSRGKGEPDEPAAAV